MDREQEDEKSIAEQQPPPARGVRLEWNSVPSRLRSSVEQWVGSSIVSTQSQPSGFSPGVAARLLTADGRRIFVKAVGPTPNPDSPIIHQREARIAAALPPGVPVPRLLWSSSDPETGWVILLFEDIEGTHPAQPWQPDELQRVLDALEVLAAMLTPSPLLPPTVHTASVDFMTDTCGWRRLLTEQPSRLDRLDAWSLRYIDKLAERELDAGRAVAGDTLLHMDIRADNILLTPGSVWFVDWPHACVGAPWIDVVLFAPSVAMQGGPPPKQLIMRHSACRTAHPTDVTAAIVALAGYFTHRAVQDPPPGLPTVRAFQAAQGRIARDWVAQRTGWTDDLPTQ